MKTTKRKRETTTAVKAKAPARAKAAPEPVAPVVAPIVEIAPVAEPVASVASVAASIAVTSTAENAIALAGTAPFATHSYSFSTTGGNLAFGFQNNPVTGRGDNVGALLDNLRLELQDVSVASIPEPASLLLFGLGAIAIAARTRRNRTIAN